MEKTSKEFTLQKECFKLMDSNLKKLRQRSKNNYLKNQNTYKEKQFIRFL
jgi:hypothetical protein